MIYFKSIKNNYSLLEKYHKILKNTFQNKKL